MTPETPDATTAPPDVVVDGRRVYFAWRSDRTAAFTIPFGAFVEHTGDGIGFCIAWLPWVDTGDGTPKWTLLSLKPLSILEPFQCSRCGALGGIRDGHWFVGLSTS